ncbi:class I SAM-dependent methyltransferase [Fusicatenibacter saccharivorans]|uniref:class I SAM-dependent methyltransferase n=1 Tax=Fusicatenibacter saccharivorans TaxID=1150298 RepID=UPI001D073F66|nr:class I SAM-dependent methyltransferase [Fusicatenibacter saccharivorans]MCB7100468.1 class I SAM-dependent methyltransferase [Fusicatenibacter saccharivorans]
MLTQEQINESWTVRSDNYNRYVEEEFETDRPEKWLQIIEANAPSTHPLRVLDAGCGPGFFSILLSRAGHMVTGVDGSAGMLAHARENAVHFGVSPVLIQGDFGTLLFPANTFDLVISRNVTHIIRDHLRVYGEWLRVLKPGGVLLIFDANWHLPYQPGAVRNEAIRREYEGLKKYGRGFTHDGSYEYINSSLNPENYQVFGSAQRPDFDVGVLSQLPCTDISFVRDVTDSLWSEREGLLRCDTALYAACCEKAGMNGITC